MYKKMAHFKLGFPNLNTRLAPRVIMHALAAVALSIAVSTSIAKPLRYATQDEPQTLDPHSANLAVTNRLLGNVYEGLVGRDKDFKMVPWLALSWSQPDAKTWRFKLRPGVKFHDSSPFTADDVVFSIERALSPNSQMKASVQGAASAKTIDDLTVDILMKEPNPVLLNHMFFFRIMSKSWAIKNNALLPQNYKDKEDTFASRNTNGTGPYMVTVRQPDVKTELVENPNWWNKASPDRGNISAVTLLPIKNNATRLAALLSGEVDFINDPPSQDIARLRAAPNITMITGAESRVQFLAFDLNRDELLYSNVKGKNPFKDIRVRQAIAHAIDAETIKSKVMRGLARPTGTIITPVDQGYSKDADVRLPYNIVRAKALMKEAGYANGFDITLDCGSAQPPADICQAIAPMLARINIKVTPNIVPTANYFQKIQKFDTSFYLLSWSTPTSDALYTLQSLLRSYSGDSTGNGDSNYGRYSSAKMDQLIDKIRIENDLKKRDEFIRETLMLANDELPILPIHQQLWPWAMRKGATATLPPNNVPYFFRFSLK